MRKKLFLVLTVVLFLGFSGCDDDNGYSLGKFWISTATIETTGSNSYVIVTDDGDRLFPSASDVPCFDVKDKQRVWVNFTVLGEGSGNIDYLVKVNDMSEILTKGILYLTAQNNDSIGDDPVKIKNYWISGDFLTIRFTYGGGKRIHYINLVQDAENPVNNEGKPVLLFRHNRKDDPANYLLHGTVSFNLFNLRVNGQTSVQFVLKATLPEGETPFEVTLTYNYN